MTEQNETPEAQDPTPEPDGEQAAATALAGEPGGRNLGLILDVRVPLTVHLGGAEMEIRDILDLSQGSIIALDKLAGEPVDVYVRGRLLAKGEVIVIDENFGVRITAICEPEHRVTALR